MSEQQQPLTVQDLLADLTKGITQLASKVAGNKDPNAALIRNYVVPTLAKLAAGLEVVAAVSEEAAAVAETAQAVSERTLYAEALVATQESLVELGDALEKGDVAAAQKHLAEALAAVTDALDDGEDEDEDGDGDGDDAKDPEPEPAPEPEKPRRPKPRLVR